MKHIKQLDSIRALAVFLVIIHHWMPWKKITSLHLGEVGVGVFFVLSGFLITRILLENRNQAEGEKASKATVFRNFFLRRALRIFPIYYITIFLLFTFSESTGTSIKENFIYFLTYTSNIYFEQRGSWEGMLSHLWSLAVEEQFYLFWPPLILLINRKYLLHAIFCFIAIGIFSQYSISKSEFTGGGYVYNCFDAFGIGAILSWIMVFKPDYLSKMYRILCFLTPLCLILFLTGVYTEKWIILPMRTLIGVVGLYVITYIVCKAQTNDIRFSFIFNNKALVFIGKISYGIYLYHLILPHYTFDFLNAINSHLPFTTRFEFYIVLLENFTLLLLLSWLSWMIIEKPVLMLKKYFEYEPPKHVPVLSISDTRQDLATHKYE